jgi:hypothetical protein
MDEVKRVYHFSYPPDVKNQKHEEASANSQVRWNRDFQRTRDGTTLCELFTIIANAGYEFGDTILNLWFEKTAPVPSLDNKADVRNSDLIVATTRCPLNDHESKKSKRIRPSDTPREHDVFHTLKTCFLERCSRTEIGLQEQLRNALQSQNLGTGLYNFTITRGSFLDPRQLAIGFCFYAPYLLRAGEPEYRGPKFLLCFGMAGTENLIWARALRKSHSGLLSHIIKSDQFWAVLGTWPPNKAVPPPRPETLSFVNELETTLVVFSADAPQKPLPEGDNPWRPMPSTGYPAGQTV